MSAKRNLTIKNVKTVSKTKKRAGISSNCICEREHRDHRDHRNDHQNCDCRRDSAVDAVQHAGKELSEIFSQLRCEEVAEQLVRAIRCRDARTIQRIIGCDCRVVHFFCTNCSDCVKICCSFGRNREVTVSFDICIKRRFDGCHRRW